MACRAQPKLLKLGENKILAEQESLEEEQHYETCAAIQLIKLGIKTGSWECTAMEWRPFFEARRYTLELGVSSQVCCSFRGVATSRGTLAGDFVRSHVPTMKAAPLGVTAGSVARRE